ncbi:MAG: hypothetical protein ACPLZG_08680 [Thermoproteota archaeon]|jgi:hypothetical protein
MEKKARKEEEGRGVRADTLKIKSILKIEHFKFTTSFVSMTWYLLLNLINNK